MADRVLKIWYIKEADILEVFWGDKSNYLAGTDTTGFWRMWTQRVTSRDFKSRG
jgi:hypothetical protein